ncbi:MAG: V-type ATP synthase subunit D [Pseudomonadota bacterium]
MAEKIKLNKTALKKQRDALAKFQKFLPILVLKKMQLQLVLRQLEPVIDAKRSELEKTMDGIRPWAHLLADPDVDIRDYVQMDEIITRQDNVAGVEVPEFDNVVFQDVEYSLFATPTWLDVAVDSLKTMVSLKAELTVLRDRESLLREELRRTAQRVNLFEKRLIPDLKEDIRRIKIFLGDEETAAVGRAKLAKSKLSALEELNP